MRGGFFLDTPILTLLTTPVFYLHALRVGLLIASLGRITLREPLRRILHPFLFSFCALCIGVALPWSGAERLAEILAFPPERLCATYFASLREDWPDAAALPAYILTIGPLLGLPLTAIMHMSMSTWRQFMLQRPGGHRRLPEGREPLVTVVLVAKMVLGCALYLWLTVQVYRQSAVAPAPPAAALVCRLAAVALAVLMLVLLFRRLVPEPHCGLWLLAHGVVTAAGMYATAGVFFPLLMGAALLPAWAVYAMWGPRWDWKRAPAWWGMYSTRSGERSTRIWALPDIPDEEIPGVAALLRRRRFSLPGGVSLAQQGERVVITSPGGDIRTVEGITDELLDARALPGGVIHCFTAAGELLSLPAGDEGDYLLRSATGLFGGGCESAAFGDDIHDLVVVQNGKVFHIVTGRQEVLPVTVPGDIPMRGVARLRGLDAYLLSDREGGAWYKNGREQRLHRAGI